MRVKAKCLAATRSGKGGNWSQCGLRTGKHINTLMKDSLPERKLLEKMNKCHCPGDCESLTEVCVNQAVWDGVWDNLSPSVHVRLQDVKIQKVRLCLKACVPWHTWLKNLLTNSTTTCWKWAVSRGYTPNANMADHSVGARNELHESEAGQPRCFVLTCIFPLKNLASWTV